jgi:NADH:ubiquinone oxidoreductase subunit H
MVWHSFVSCIYYFFIFCLVETNRTPFDLPKAKAEFAAELVTG